MYETEFFQGEGRTLPQAVRSAWRSYQTWLSRNPNIELLPPTITNNQDRQPGVMYQFEVCILITFRRL